MGMTRKHFLSGLAGGTVVLLVQSCGGGGGGGTTTGGVGGGGYGGSGMVLSGCADAAITNNHGHALAIPATDLDSTSNKSYSIAGTAGHDHMITLTPAQLGSLKGGASVVVTSTVTNAAGFGSHAHDVTVSCA